MDRKKGKEWGSDIIRTRISREPYILEKRTWRDLHFWEWTFIIFALLSVVTSIGFSVYQLVYAIIEKDTFIFPVLVILNNLFAAYFLWNGVIEELPFKLLIQLVIKSIIWVFDLIFFLLPSKDAGIGEEDDDTRKEIRNIRFYVSCAMLFLTITSGGIVIYQYFKSNISVFRMVGTEPKYVRLYRMWTLSHSMILFDAVLFVTVIFHLWDFPEFLRNYSTYYLVPVWLIATVAYVLLGIKAIERESRLLTYVFYVVSHFQPVFIIFLLVKASRSSLGLLLYISLYVTSLLYIIFHVGELITIVRLQNNYGMGLKQAAAREVERQNLVKSAEILNSPGNQSAGNDLAGSQLLNRGPATETEL